MKHFIISKIGENFYLFYFIFFFKRLSLDKIRYHEVKFKSKNLIILDTTGDSKTISTIILISKAKIYINKVSTELAYISLSSLTQLMKPSPTYGGPSSLGIFEVEVLIMALFLSIARIWIPPPTILPHLPVKLFVLLVDLVPRLLLHELPYTRITKTGLSEKYT